MYEIYEQLLQKHGVTSYKVSKDTGIAQSVLSAWKTGVSTPKSDKMQILADYFGVPVEYLTTGKYPEDIDQEFVAHNDHEKRVLLSFRGAGKLTDDEMADLEDMFESTIDLYLKARGKKTK